MKRLLLLALVAFIAARSLVVLLDSAVDGAANPDQWVLGVAYAALAVTQTAAVVAVFATGTIRLKRRLGHRLRSRS